MIFWQRLLITVLVMLATSIIVSAIWKSIFNMIIPGYIAGVVAGLAALPVWEFLKRIKPKKEEDWAIYNFILIRCMFSSKANLFHCGCLFGFMDFKIYVIGVDQPWIQLWQDMQF